GLFAAERKRPLPRLPRRIGLVTGNDAAAKRDVLAAITARFPAANVVVAETYVQGPRAAVAVIEALRALCGRPELDVIVVARGGSGERHRERLDRSHERLRAAPRLALEGRRSRLERTAARLRALSPKATMERGYAIVRREGAVVRAAEELERGVRVEVELGRGGVEATVEETR